VFDQAQALRGRCNLDTVELEAMVDDSDLWLVRGLIEDHVRRTDSPRGTKILDNWDHLVARFVKVMPTDYRRVLERRRAATRRSA
jgi:glutamate synthase (NADPH/NADH) large chain